jgi:hypothetical protein
MPSSRPRQACALLIATAFTLVAAASAQQPSSTSLGPGPVAAMFAADQKRDAARAASFEVADLPASKAAAFPARVYLSAGDLERAFDRPEFRPEAAIVPTNTDLALTAPQPTTQRVLIDRVRRQPAVMRDLEEQVAMRKKQAGAAPAGEPGLLQIGLGTFVVQLSRGAAGGRPAGAFPKSVCLIATDFAKGGAIDRRELFVQDRLRKGVEACLSALDAAGARSVVLPLMGAASSETQRNDALFEGQRVLMECRLINSTAGIALGIHDFAAGRRNLREIGIVQWDREIDVMFKVPAGNRAAQSAQTAYRTYAEQVAGAFRRGLAGEKTTASDLKGSCTAILDAP